MNRFGAATLGLVGFAACSVPLPPVEIAPPPEPVGLFPPASLSTPPPAPEAAEIREFLAYATTQDLAAAYLREHPALASLAAAPHGSALLWAIVEGAEEPALALIAAGARDDGALRAAAGAGLDRTVLSLLLSEAEVDAADESGTTALHLAASNGHATTVALLLEHGASVDIRVAEDQDFTALHYAVIGRHAQVVDLLVAAKANVHARDAAGRTPLSWAAEVYRPIPVRIYQLSAMDAPLHQNQTRDPGRADPVKALVAAGANVDSRDRAGRTPLITAAQHGAVRAVEALLAAGASRRAKDDEGQTALDVAEVRGDQTIIDLLRAK